MAKSGKKRGGNPRTALGAVGGVAKSKKSKKSKRTNTKLAAEQPVAGQQEQLLPTAVPRRKRFGSGKLVSHSTCNRLQMHCPRAQQTPMAEVLSWRAVLDEAFLLCSVEVHSHPRTLPPLPLPLILQACRQHHSSWRLAAHWCALTRAFSWGTVPRQRRRGQRLKPAAAAMCRRWCRW